MLTADWMAPFCLCFKIIFNKTIEHNPCFHCVRVHTRAGRYIFSVSAWPLKFLQIRPRKWAVDSVPSGVFLEKLKILHCLFKWDFSNLSNLRKGAQKYKRQQGRNKGELHSEWTNNSAYSCHYFKFQRILQIIIQTLSSSQFGLIFFSLV